MTVGSPPSKFLAYVAVGVGSLLLLSGLGTLCSHLGLSFAAFRRDVLGAQLGQIAAIFLGLICGSLAVYHGYGSITGRISRSVILPPVYLFWILFAIALGIGHLLLEFKIAQNFLFPFIFLLGAALPSASVSAWALRRLGWPLTWRQGALALVAGCTLSIFLAITLEALFSFVAYFLIPPFFNEFESARSVDLFTRLIFSPALVVFLALVALQAPIPEEFSKALGAILFGRKRITNERQAFAIGLVCGAGFAILENMVYEGIFATRGGLSWGGVTLLRGIGGALHPLGTAIVVLGWYRAQERGWGELLKAYAVAVGLHTLWNGGFTAFVYLTGLEYFSRRAAVAIYGMPVQIVLIVFLAALSLVLSGLLYWLTARLAQGTTPALSPVLVSRRALAGWAFACAIVVVPLGAVLGAGWEEIRTVALAGPATPTPTPTATFTSSPTRPSPTRSLTPTSIPATTSPRPLTATPTMTALPLASFTTTATRISTATTIIPSAKATLAAASQSRLILAETFQTNTRRWASGEFNTDTVTEALAFADGKYRWEARAKKTVVSVSRPVIGAVSLNNFFVTAEMQRVEGIESSSYGVIFRDNGTTFYLFAIADNQTFIFDMVSRNERTSILRPTKSMTIRPGEVNRVSVLGQGSHFVFYINDEYVAEADNEILPNGRLGLGISLLNAGDSAVFEFDNFDVRAP